MAVRKLAPEDMQPESFVLSPETEAFADKEIAKYPPGRQASAVIAAAVAKAQEQAGGWLPRKAIEAVAAQARHAGHPRDGGGDLLHDVQPRAGRKILHPVLRHDALRRCAERATSRRCCERRIGEQNHVTAGRHVLLARGRVPGRLLQRADGADQRRLLRGPDDRELREASRRSRRRPAGEGRVRRSAASGRSLSRPSTLCRTRRSTTVRVVGAWRKRFEEQAKAAETGEAAAAVASVPQEAKAAKPACGPRHRERCCRYPGQARQGRRAADQPDRPEGSCRSVEGDQGRAATEAGAQPAPQSGKSYVATPTKEGEAVPAEPDDARGRYAACASRDPPRRQRKQAGRDRSTKTTSRPDGVIGNASGQRSYLHQSLRLPFAGPCRPPRCAATGTEPSSCSRRAATGSSTR